MVLDAPGVEIPIRNPLDRTVVEVTVGQLDAFGEGISDGEAVVLAGDFDPACPYVADRVVGAMMPERHLVRCAPEGQPE